MLRARSLPHAAVVVLVAAAACEGFHEFEGDAGTDAGVVIHFPPRDARTGDAGPADARARDGSSADATLASPFAIVQGVAQGESLLAVWGADAQDIFAVGSNGLHCTYHQSAWSCSQDILGRDYYGVWGTSATDVYCAGTVGPDGGSSGVVEHWDGTQWTDVYLAPTPLSGVWGVGANILAIGASGQVYGVSPGTNDMWEELIQLPPNSSLPAMAGAPMLSGISGVSATDFEIAGGLDAIFQSVSGGQIATLYPDVDTNYWFQSVWAVPGNTATAFFGSNFFGVSQLTGKATGDAADQAQQLYRIFQDESLADAAQLYIWGIWGTPLVTGFCGDLGRIYVFHEADTSFSPVPSPTDQSLYGMWGSSLDDVWIVGQNQLILHGSLPP